MTASHPDPSRVPRTSLRANAAFSSLSGAAFALAGPPIAGSHSP